MSSAYANFTREPSSPHQCMHSSEKDGTRCRATAMHNQYMCYHHRSDDIPTVIENDPFEIASLAGHDAIQQALTDVAARLACNRIDFKRAALLLQSLQIATSNLNGRERQAANANAASRAGAGAPHLASEMWQPQPFASSSDPVVPTQQPTAKPNHPEPLVPTPGTQPPTPNQQPATNNQQPANLPTVDASTSPDHPLANPCSRPPRHLRKRRKAPSRR